MTHIAHDTPGRAFCLRKQAETHPLGFGTSGCLTPERWMGELGLASQTHARSLLEWADVDHVVAPRVIVDGAAWDTRRDDRADRELSMTAESEGADWRLRGVRVVRADELVVNTPQTPGMNRAAAINAARAGAEKLWAGTVIIHPAAETGAHHHGPLESVIYVVSGRARMRWGERLEYTAEAGPGDFIYVPPFVPHQEINARPDAPLSCVVVRSGQEPVVVNLDLPAIEPNPEQVYWVDDIHREP